MGVPKHLPVPTDLWPVFMALGPGFVHVGSLRHHSLLLLIRRTGQAVGIE